MALIVLLHILTKGYGISVNNIESLPTGLNGSIGLSLLSLSSLGVTGFIFISGYYGVKFKIDRIVKLWSQTSFYALISVIVTIVVIGGGANSLKSLFDVPISLFDKWWFIQSYLILMCLSPFINKGLECITKSQFTVIVSLLVFMQYGVAWFHCASSGPGLMKFVVIYMVGAYCHKFPINKLVVHSKHILLASLSFVILAPVLVHLLSCDKMLKWILTSFNIMYLLTVISLLYMSVEKPVMSKGNMITRNTLAIYLFHESSAITYILWTSSIFDWSEFNLLRIFVVVLLLMVISILIEELRITLFSKKEDRLAKWLINKIR